MKTSHVWGFKMTSKEKGALEMTAKEVENTTKSQDSEVWGHQTLDHSSSSSATSQSAARPVVCIDTSKKYLQKYILIIIIIIRLPQELIHMQLNKRSCYITSFF
jgi:hypothetical protein